MSYDVLCVGEVLWDALPAGLFLGGAPLNVAVHLRQLGVSSAMVSSVGDDELGREICRRLERLGVSDEYLQIHHSLPTGFVVVTLKSGNEPSYEIVEPSAWDEIELTDSLEKAISDCRALIFGSLAQRDSVSRQAIQHLIEEAPLRIFDVNFRPPFVDKEVVEFGLRESEVVKLNIDELNELAGWKDWQGSPRELAAQMAGEYQIQTLCVTRGGGGAFLLHEGVYAEHRGVRVEVRDAVGAGDAFLASLVRSLLAEEPFDPDKAVARANVTGAYVASRDGATPTLKGIL